MRASSALVILVGLVLVGCTDLADKDERRDAGVDSSVDDAGMDAADAIVDAAPDADDCVVPPTGCPPLCARERVTLGSALTTRERIIAADLTLDCDHVYDLVAPTYIEPGATLTVEAGVIVESGRMGVLIAESGARIVATGTVEDPIVFRGEAEPGSWAGLVMLGDAPVSVSENPRDPMPGATRLFAPLDGSDEEPNERVRYGGTDDAHDCGSLRYVRIEYGGVLNRLFIPEDIPVLTLAGCGSETSLDYVQIHAAGGESTKFIGGGFPLRHFVASEVQDDVLEWDRGWTGSIQWAVVHQAFDNENNGIEGRISAFPFPDIGPAVANVTIINPFSDGRAAMYLTAGSGMRGFNILVHGGFAGLDVFETTITNPGFFDTDFFTLENSIVDPGIPFTEDSAVGARVDPPNRGNRSIDPQMPAGLLADDLSDPDFQPSASGPANSGAAAALPAELELTDYIGAIDPDGEDWTQGWTSYDP